MSPSCMLHHSVHLSVDMLPSTAHGYGQLWGVVKSAAGTLQARMVSCSRNSAAYAATTPL